MANSTFPKEFHFSVWRGNSGEGADFTITGEPDSDFTDYIGILRIAPLRTGAFHILTPVILAGAPNVGLFKPRFTLEQTRLLDAGAVNSYDFEKRSPGQSWQKTCFVGRINGMGGLNLDV